MKSKISKLSACLVLAFCFMSINNTSAQANKGVPANPPKDGPVTIDTPSGYKTKSDCIKFRASTIDEVGASQAYKITVDYGNGKVQSINRTLKIDSRKTSALDCKCYPNSENLTITYVKSRPISRVSMVGSAECK